MLRYVHGSADSTDIDVIYVFDEIPARSDATKFCGDNSVENKNIIVVRDGIVSWVYKGTIDEVNNALFRTIPLHPENSACIIERMVERNILNKAIRVMRGTLTQCSRTKHRQDIKEATTSSSWKKRVSVLSQMNISTIDDFVKDDKINVYKFFAFQWGQLMGLAEGKELYTKAEVSLAYPMLKPYLYRKSMPFNAGLDHFYDAVVNFMGDLHVIEDGESVRFTDYGKVYDLKKEIELNVEMD